MNLTEHFTLEEMLRSDTASKKNIENRINAEEVNCFCKANAAEVLPKATSRLFTHYVVLPSVRCLLGSFCAIGSGIAVLSDAFATLRPIRMRERSKALNEAVGGAKNSYHTKGRAADIPFVPGYYAYIRDHLPHVELINEGSWLHVAL